MFNSLEYERTRRNNAVRDSFTDEQKRSWARTRSAHRFLAKLGTNLVVFKYTGGHLKNLLTLSCVDFEVDKYLGISSVWFNGDKVIEVGYLPVEVAPSVFLVHPRLSSVEMRDNWGSQDELLFSFCYYAPANPHKSAIEGVNYILEESVFNKLSKY